jgi:uncharacterized protein (TIGR00290 family)
VTRPRAVVSWSSGKDAAWALHAVRAAGELEVVGLLTSVNDAFGRVAMHGVREELLLAQARAVGLPCRIVRLPWPCSNDAYERAMGEALAAERAGGVTHVVFGDLFLEDVRRYREAQLAAAGLTPVFPLWGRSTRALAAELLGAGVRAFVTCVDPDQADASLAGRAWDEALVAGLPDSVDPCGERGEFHTFAWDGPMFAAPVPVVPGEVVERDGFVFAELVAAPPRGEDRCR